MKLYEFASDEAVVRELGVRVARRRISHELTQQALADEAGIAKRTLERIESGEGDARISAYIRILRALDLMDRLELLVPEGEPGPMELLISARSGRGAVAKSRKRVSSRRAAPLGSTADGPAAPRSSGWTWGEEP
jgi:transcriptional regulator with XRE-family HTH domain